LHLRNAVRAHHPSVMLDDAFAAVEPLARRTADGRLAIGVDYAALLD